MLDPMIELCRTSAEEVNNDKSSNVKMRSGFPRRWVVAYNPFESLSQYPIPDSFYETLSFLCAFTPIICTNNIDLAQFVYTDLDPTEGFSMAIQGRYPRARCYALSTKQWSKGNIAQMDNSNPNLFLGANGMDPRNFNTESSTYESLLDNCIFNNCRGINLSYAAEDATYNTEAVKVAKFCLQEGAYMVYRVRDYTSEWCRTVCELMWPYFDSLTLYKPATMSCVSRECLIIGLGRRQADLDPKHMSEDWLVSQLDVLEEYRQRAVEGISAQQDNTNTFNTHKAKIDYLGLH